MSAFLRLLERKLQPTSTMVVLKTFALLATLFGTVQSSCSRTNYLTARELSSYRYVSYSSSDFCTFNINPSSSLSGSYFLQITWLSFNVKGNMPDCSKDDYVQVYLTRSYKSIGKFCSSNSGKPFTMYSHDGYAKIVVNADAYNNGYFSINYVLKSKTSNTLGFSSFTSCLNTYSYSSSGVIYSKGWPKEYDSSSSSCKHRITRSYGKNAMKVIFMDLNLDSSSYQSDCIEIQGSNYSSSYFSHYIGKVCSSSYPRSYITYDKYVQLEFDRNVGSNYRRGFVAGYIAFSKKHDTSHKQSKSTFSTMVWKIFTPLIIVGVAFGILCKYRRQMRLRNNAMANRQAVIAMNTNQTAASTITTDATGATTTMTSSSDQYPKSSYPGSTYPGAIYPTANNAYPPSSLAYPTAGAYPTTTGPYPSQGGTYPAHGYAPPTYDAATSSEAGNNGQSTQPVGQTNPHEIGVNPAGEQTAEGSVQAPTSSSAPAYPTNTQGVTYSAHGGPQTSFIPPVEQSGTLPDAPPPAYPNVPPPAYNSVQN